MTTITVTGWWLVAIVMMLGCSAGCAGYVLRGRVMTSSIAYRRGLIAGIEASQRGAEKGARLGLSAQQVADSLGRTLRGMR